jgi:hypothetical protein
MWDFTGPPQICSGRHNSARVPRVRTSVRGPKMKGEAHNSFSSGPYPWFIRIEAEAPGSATADLSTALRSGRNDKGKYCNGPQQWPGEQNPQICENRDRSEGETCDIPHLKIEMWGTRGLWRERTLQLTVFSSISSAATNTLRCSHATTQY